MKLLIVEDDAAIAEGLAAYLAAEGFSAVRTDSETEAKRLMQQPFDLLLVDLALNEGSGYGVCEAAKAKGLPVIFLTAAGDESSVVRGLDMGADDYIAKPFRPRELLSRIRSVLRRSGAGDALMLNGVLLDPARGGVTKNGEPVPLSALEYRLLTLFWNNRGRVLTRERLLEDIWDACGDFVNDNTLTVYIKRLRDKLEDDPQNPVLIKTVRGIGYRVD